MIERCRSGAPNVTFDLSVVTIALEFKARTYTFTAITDVQTVSGGKYYCGTFTEQTISGGKNSSLFCNGYNIYYYPSCFSR